MFTCPMRHAPLCRPSRSACSKPLYQERRHDQAVLSHRRWMALAATGGGDVQQYTFGAPAAPTEIWQEFEREARSAFVEETSSEDCDIVMAALQLAAEDDAVSTRSTVPLPVDSYSKRLDTIVRESRARLQQAGPDASPEEQLGVVCDFFYGTLGYKAATGVLELYSPYRVYMHNVLAQKCGTTAALGVLVWGLLFRLRSCGAIAFDFQVGLPPEGHEPVTRVAGPSGAVQGTDLGATSSPFVRWLQPREMLLETLLILKRSYWAWNWPKGAPSCFVPPAEAFLGTYGRAGQSSEVVGVMQPTGRPFGNLHLALRATERLAVLLGGAQGGLRGAQELRDMAVLLCHLNRNGDSERAASLLQEYQQFLIGANLLPGDHDAETASPLLLLKDAEGRSVTRTEVRLLMELQKKLDQLKLEACFQAPPAAKESA